MRPSNKGRWPPNWRQQQPQAVGEQIFTLQQEAFRTTKQPAFWSEESKLRHNPVSFVSAGIENPLEEIETELDTNEADEGSSAKSNPAHCKEPGKVSSSMNSTDEVFQSQIDRPISSAGSVSGDEEPVLVFKGRKPATPQPAPPPAESFQLDSIAKELGNLDQPSLITSHEVSSGPASGVGQFATMVPTAATTRPEASSDEEHEGEAMSPIEVSDGHDEGEEDVDIDVEAMARFFRRDIGGSDNEFGLKEDQGAPSEADSDMEFDMGHSQSFGSGRPRRLKKAERKKLHEQGLLKKPSKNGKDNDLWTKYPTSMKITEVVEETRLFLMRSEELVLFPPLAKHHRKMVHDLANRLSLKSKSVGKAETRRPTLHRTKRTPLYSDDWFDSMAEPLIARWSGRKFTKTPRNNGHIKTGYRDGDIVGEGLPELGQENRGRNMLEKMGWSTGTALGAVENKGILHPVAQVVKRTKAGLG